MEIESMKCPNCGALVYFEKDQDRCFCSHCGSQLQFSDPNNKKITYTKIDAARIREAETHESIRQRELDIQEQQLDREKKQQTIKAILIVVAIIACAAIVIYIFSMIRSGVEGGYTGLLFLILIISLGCLMIQKKE